MVSLAALRKGEDARRILAEVFAAARSMDHADDRRRILSHIASVQIDASLFPDALATVRAQDDSPEKAKDFCRIADAQITTGCKDQAGKTLAETLPLAGRVAAPWRDDVFEEIAHPGEGRMVRRRRCHCRQMQNGCRRAKSLLAIAAVCGKSRCCQAGSPDAH